MSRLQIYHMPSILLFINTQLQERSPTSEIRYLKSDSRSVLVNEVGKVKSDSLDLKVLRIELRHSNV